MHMPDSSMCLRGHAALRIAATPHHAPLNTPTPRTTQHTPTQHLNSNADPFESIGYTMVTLINLGAGLSHYEYAYTCRSNYALTTVFCTIYYLLYIATVLLLLMNLLTGV